MSTHHCWKDTANDGRKGARQPLLTRELRLGTWRALCDARSAGLLTVAGVSNYGIVYLREIEEAHGGEDEGNIDYKSWAKALSKARAPSHGVVIDGYLAVGSWWTVRVAVERHEARTALADAIGANIGI